MSKGKKGQDPFEVALAQEGISGVMADIARSIYMQESSGGKNTKTSNAGAVGGMQVMPATFKGLADEGWDNNDPVHNARVGMRLIRQLHNANGGDPSLTAVGYYGGQGAVNKAKRGEAVSDPRNPNAPDTFRYSDEVLSRMPNNESYTRLSRGSPYGSSANAPVPAAPPNQPNQQPTQPNQAPPQEIPQNIPAYFGTPDKWSNFGRAMPNEGVRPEGLNYGMGEVPKPLIPAANTGIFESIIGQAAQPMQVNFKRWGR